MLTQKQITIGTEISQRSLASGVYHLDIDKLSIYLAEQEERMSKLEEKLDSFVTGTVSMEKHERWQPEQDEEYFYIDFSYPLVVGSYQWNDDGTDHRCWEANVVFRTREEAEAALAKIREVLKEHSV